MNCLSPSIALGLPPEGADRVATIDGLEEARAGVRPIEVRIGVGALEAGAPARVLAHAECIAEAIGVDLSKIVGDRPYQIMLVSSAMKLGKDAPGAILVPLAALAGALTLANVCGPIAIEVADPETEVTWPVELRPTLEDWVAMRALQHHTPIDVSRRYALEHAAPSMFGDIAESHLDPPLRVTVGGAMEGRFWAIRMRVRAAASAAGIRLAPALALIMKAVKIPWYSPTPSEPSISALANPAAAIAALDAAANPKYGGNVGLKREARAFDRAARRAGAQELAAAVGSSERAATYLKESMVDLGPRLRALVESTVRQ